MFKESISSMVSSTFVRSEEERSFLGVAGADRSFMEVGFVELNIAPTNFSSWGLLERRTPTFG
jgi:hypothetical protein